MRFRAVRRMRKEGCRMVESPKGHWIRYSEYERDMATVKVILDQLPATHIDLAIFFANLGFPPAQRADAPPPPRSEA